MKVIWTPKAIAEWQEVADYILESFGVDAMLDFETRTYEAEMVADFWDVRKNK